MRGVTGVCVYYAALDRVGGLVETVCNRECTHSSVTVASGH